MECQEFFPFKNLTPEIDLGNVVKCCDGSWVDKALDKLKKKCKGYHTDSPSSSSFLLPLHALLC